MPGHRFRNFTDQYKPILPLLLLVVFAVVMVVIVRVMREQEFDLRSLAWTGVNVNREKYRELLGGTKKEPNAVPIAMDDPTSSRSLFHSLSKTYYDAEVQNISVPDVGVSGAAFLKYDEPLGSTVIFSRIENLPILEGKIIRLWLVKDMDIYQPAGIAEVYTEAGVPVLYSVFTRPEDLRTYKQLLVSYDSTLTIQAPESVVITLDF